MFLLRSKSKTISKINTRCFSNTSNTNYSHASSFTNTNKTFNQFNEFTEAPKKPINLDFNPLAYFAEKSKDEQENENEQEKENNKSSSTKKPKPSRRDQFNFISAAVEPVLDSVCVIYRHKHKLGGMGSGFFITPQGLAITNHHLIGRGNKMYIQTRKFPNKLFSATILASDELQDLAIILVDKPRVGNHNFTCIDLAPIDQGVWDGEWVVAIGSPMNKEMYGTLTQGVVSFGARDLKDTRKLKNVDQAIQHTCLISRGSSGGPLINLDSQVVGVNSQVKVIIGASYGFAIPVSAVHEFLNTTFPNWNKINFSDPKNQLKAEAKYKLSVRIATLDHNLATEMARETGDLRFNELYHGLLIISSDNPDLKVNDVILTVQNKKIDFMSFVRKVHAGEPFDVEIWREGKKMKMTLKPHLKHQHNLKNI